MSVELLAENATTSLQPKPVADAKIQPPPNGAGRS